MLHKCVGRYFTITQKTKLITWQVHMLSLTSLDIRTQKSYIAAFHQRKKEHMYLHGMDQQQIVVLGKSEEVCLFNIMTVLCVFICVIFASMKNKTNIRSLKI